MNKTKIEEVTAILGHRPTDAVLRIIEKLEAIVDEYQQQHPEISKAEVWDIIKTKIEAEIQEAEAD